MRAFLSSADGWVRAALAQLFHSRLFLIGIVEFELLLGLLLLSGFLPRLTYAWSLLCFGGFALVSLYKALSGDASCGCLGRVPVNPWYTFGLDTCAVLALLRRRPRNYPSMSERHARGLRPLPFFVTVWLTLAAPLGLWAVTPPGSAATDLGDIFADGKTVILKPERWLGKRLPLLDYIDIRDRLADGEWTVVLYRHDCPRCREQLSKYDASWTEPFCNAQSEGLAFIDIAPPERDGPQWLPNGGVAVFGRLTGVTEWFAVTPCTLRLTGGAVLSVKLAPALTCI